MIEELKTKVYFSHRDTGEIIMLTRDAIDKMNEAPLRDEVIIPLLRAMGYKDVFLYHGGAGEQGKDIVCWKLDDLGCRENLAIVAKATQMSGKAKLDDATAAEVQTQIRQCFGKSYTAPVSSEEQSIHRVWVVSNKKITKEAQEAIKSAVGTPDMTRNVRFIDGDALWDLVKNHLPSSIWHYITEVRKHSEVVDSPYVPQITIGPNKTEITIVERFPGAAKQEPLKVSGQFVFPTKEDKEKFDKAFQHHIETGESFEVPTEYIGKVELPEFMRAMLGMESFQPQSVRIQPAPMPQQMRVRLTLRCDDGEEFVCHLVHLTATRFGTKEMALVGNRRDAPCDLEIVLQHFVKEASISTQPWTVPYNAVQYLNFLKMRVCLSKPVFVEAFSLDLGVKVFGMRLPGDKDGGPHPEQIEFVGKLATLQQKFMVPLYIPDRDLTDEEVETIEELHDAITTGRSESEWLSFKTSIRPTQEAIDAIIETFCDGKLGFLTLKSNRTEELFGVQLPVGVVREIAHNARLGNIEELTSRYDELLTAESLELEFVPADGAMLVKEYEQWLPRSEAEKIKDETNDPQVD